jgi:hypothetical protein
LPLECRYQVPTAAVFKGGEGCWYDSGIVYFTTKGTNRVWAYDTRAERVDIIYDAAELGETAPLTGVDNITVHPFSHDLFVAEDGGNMELVMITRDRTVAPFLRYPVPHSELAGPAFDPSGTRLYIASQAKRHREDENGNEVRGEIFEITGPFNQRALDGEDSASSRLASTAAGGSTALLTLGGLTLAGLASRIAASHDDDLDAG